MEYWPHAFTSTLTGLGGVAIMLYMRHIPGPLVLVAFFCFALPDTDKKLKDLQGDEGGKHRHWFHHSAILPILTLLLGVVSSQGVDGVGIFALVIGMHLLCDLKPGERGKRGYYLIHVRKGKRLTRRGTDQWLALNGFTCIVLGMLSVVVA